MEDDEALARRLQAEELGAARFQAGLRQPLQDERSPLQDQHAEPRDHRRLQQRVRGNMAQQVNGVWGTSKKYLAFMLLFFLSEAIATVAVVYSSWDELCDKPLATFLIVWSMRLVLSAPLAVQRYRVGRLGDEEALRRVERAQSLMQICEFVWFIVGQSWLFSCSCKQTAPALYWLSMTYVILVYVRIALPLLLLVLICMCWPCLTRVLRQSQGGAPGADGDVIGQLPTRVYGAQPPAATPDLEAGKSSAAPNASPSDCSICMETYHNGDKLRSLPCHHEFHQACVDPWLGLHATCPLCRAAVAARA
jgi:hypothetical protein